MEVVHQCQVALSHLIEEVEGMHTGCRPLSPADDLRRGEVERLAVRGVFRTVRRTEWVSTR
jgi:hypothetical protein